MAIGIARSIEIFGKGRGTMLHGIYQMTPRQFRKAIDAGVFGEKRVELLGGIPFVMSQNPPHTFASRPGTATIRDKMGHCLHNFFTMLAR